jgi:hypothetical protein
MGTRGQAHPNFQQRRSAFDVAENAVHGVSTKNRLNYILTASGLTI